MELKINRERIPITETILDDTQQQSIELDYVLPDYDPDIFRILRCEICPTIPHHTTGTDRISYELCAEIRVLYCAPGSARIQCVAKQLTFSRNIELPRPAESPTITLSPKTAYANCRAISPRRLEVRGAVSIQIRVAGQQTQEVIRDVFGMQVQLKKTPVTYAAQRSHAEKTVVLSESIPLGDAKPPIDQILRSEVRLSHSESSILAGKLVAKGEAQVQVLYTWQTEDGGCGVEPLAFPLPYSQIVDMNPLDDSFQPYVQIQVVRCELKPGGRKDGATGQLDCEIELLLSCTAIKTATVQLVTDAFSTRYPCQQTTTSLQIDMAPHPIDATLPVSATIPPGDTVAECVYDLHCRVKNLNTQLLPDTNRIRISGMLCCDLLAKDSEGSPMLLEKEEAFEGYTDPGTSVGCATLQAQVAPMDCTYHLASDGTISVNATLALQGLLHPSARYTCLSELVVDGETRLIRDGDYALKLYYGVEHESVWEIAKRCHTSVDAIMEENDLQDEQLTTPGMLFIPIVH